MMQLGYDLIVLLSCSFFILSGYKVIDLRIYDAIILLLISLFHSLYQYMVMARTLISIHLTHHNAIILWYS